MSKVGFVRNSIYGRGLKKMAGAWRNAVERRMSESRVRENLMHGLMRGGWKFHPPTLPYRKEIGLNFNTISANYFFPFKTEKF